ncbi:MAG: 50S ribosomal protein L11 methyltransferase [Chloroflexota bacterium]
MQTWLEVSLTVDGELAEAVADVLARFAPNGVTTEQGVDFFSDEDEGTPTGPVTVRAYLPVDDAIAGTRQNLEQALHFLGMIQPLPAPTFTPIADQNWMEAWKSRYQPIPVGRRLIIVPAWLETPDPARVAIKIDPGMAFGTGTHPTTQLCLELIELHFDQNPNRPADQSVAIDVGCGSGILSIAALKLGANRVLGVDIDDPAIKASRENAAVNGVAEKLILGVGSVAEILRGDFLIQQAPLVIANILAPVIIRLFDAGLAELVAPGGTLILSGILQEQAEGVIAAARQNGLSLAESRQMGDWVALAMR